MIDKEWPIKWELPEQISLESDWFCADLKNIFNESRRSYSINFVQASYRNMKSYFTSKLIHSLLNMIKTNKRIRILKTHLPFKLLR